MPSIAVVIPVFNRPGLILECLEGVMAQDRPADRVVVVDDGSTDDTAAQVERWIAAAPQRASVTLLKQRNAGASAARNAGAAAAGPIDLLAFLDSDDVWPTDFLRRAELAMASQPDAVAGSADKLNFNPYTRETRFISVKDVATETTRRLFVDGPPGTSNTVFRANHFRALGGYDPELLCSEDYHLMLRLSLRGPWVHLAGAPVRYQFGEDPTPGSTPRLSKRYSDRRLQLAKMMDRFVFLEGGAAALPGEPWRPRLVRLWYQAGRQLRGLGRCDEARRCFARVLELDRLHVRARVSNWMCILRPSPAFATNPID